MLERAGAVRSRREPSAEALVFSPIKHLGAVGRELSVDDRDRACTFVNDNESKLGRVSRIMDPC